MERRCDKLYVTKRVTRSLNVPLVETTSRLIKVGDREIRGGCGCGLYVAENKCEGNLKNDEIKIGM